MEVISEDEIWHDFFYTEMTTGLRRGEICGLKWEDFDEVNGTLKVRRTIYRKDGGGLTAGDTKTSTGTRKIVLPPSTSRVLRERKVTALTEWIFPNPLKPEQPTDPDAAYNRLKSLMKQRCLVLEYPTHVMEEPGGGQHDRGRLQTIPAVEEELSVSIALGG